ncbi:TRAP transporter substrate-binding protein DctP [candidate division KSB1 bacterium]|nr:TRAP transporter substrate-binding protein DctP [candidate division KSB1 bacterium]
MRRTVLMMIILLLIPVYGMAQKYQIKFASLAPDGSTWMNVMREFDAAIRAETNGEMGFKIYPGGVSGDEKDVLRKMRIGQLHSAGFTGVGIGEILPEARILDSPFLFKSYDEVDFVTKEYYDRFAKGFEENGYVLLGWTEVGFVYVFTNTPVQQQSDMKNVKMWMWEGDPVAEATFKALDVNTIPLSVINVLTALQTGMVDGVYASPLAMLALQWFTKVQYMLDYPMADASGAVLITKKQFDKLPAEYRQILVKNGEKYLGKLTKLSREENAKSIETLKENGIKMVPPPSQEAMDMFADKGKDARRLMVGKLYSHDFVESVEKSLEDYRNSK